MISEKINNWLRTQPYWQQVLGQKILAGEEVANETIAHIYDIFKKENNLHESTLDKSQIEFPSSVNNEKSSNTLKWKGLKNVKGVNAIKNSSTFPVGNSITLFYGENGSGKSSFTRLLNNIFTSRGDKTLLSNIFEDNNGMSSAEVLFEDGDELVCIRYPEEKNHTFNKRVSVFDAHSAKNDLTKERELLFSPIEFRFFDEFLKHVENVKVMFEEEVSRRNPEKEFLNHFDNKTSIKELLTLVDENTDIEELEDTIKVNDKDIERNEKNMKQKAHLQALNIEEKHKNYLSLIKDLRDIKSKVLEINLKLGKDSLTSIKKAIETHNDYKKESYEEGISQLSGNNIYHLGSTEWKTFIEAAYDYFQSIEEEFDTCIFCKQKIEDVELIEKYWTYLKSNAERNLKESNDYIESLKENYKLENEFLFIRKSTIDEWLQSEEVSLFDELCKVEDSMKFLIEKILVSLENKEWDEEIEECHFNTLKIDEAIKKIEETISKLNVTRIKEELNEIRIEEEEYNDKLKAERLIPKIKIYIGNVKWLKRAQDNKISTRAITQFQNRLFKEFVTDEYISKFDEECKKIKANFSAEIRQRGSKGTTLNKLTIKENKPVEILSEGEQRSIALANFLAEVYIHGNNECIVLDDPVSSLDYKRREVIADRLIREGENRQVVILTHDLTFLLSLQEKCEELHLDYITNTINKIHKTTGIVEESLPWIGMTVKKRIGYLRTKLQSMTTTYSKIDSDQLEELRSYEEDAKLWCEQLRETWERSIEEILFNNSVQRFNPAIQTQRLKKAPFTPELYLEVEKGMQNCSNWVHDRAAGLGEDIPDPKELETYLEECDKFVKANRI